MPQDLLILVPPSPQPIAREPRTAADLDAKRAQVEEAEIEIANIKDLGAVLFEEVSAMVRLFADRFRCEDSVVLDNIKREIESLVDDAQGPAVRRKYRAENELAELEDAQ